MANAKPGWRREYVVMIGAMRDSADELARTYATPGTPGCLRGGSFDMHQLAQAMQNMIVICDEEAAAVRCRTYLWAVTGDFSRMVYSRHITQGAAEKSCAALAAKWRREYGWIHPGSEPAVVSL